MLKIAICDSNLNEIDKVNSMVERYFTYKNIAFRTHFFQTGGDILKSEIRFHLIFLNQELNDLSGTETAEKIRDFDVHVPIVFMSESTSNWRSTYRVHAFDFIKKPLEYDELFNVMNDFFKYTKDRNCNFISLNTDNGAFLQNTSEICYFIVDSKRKLIMRTINENYFIKENLSSVFSKLDKTQFYMPHRSSILNFDYVDYVFQFNIIMKNGEFVPLAQKKKKEFLRKLHEFFRRV